MRSFKSGEDSLLNICHGEAKKHFEMAIYLFGCDSSNHSIKNDCIFNQAICFFYKGDYHSSLESLNGINKPNETLTELIKPLYEAAKLRCSGSFWEMLYKDYCFLINDKKYDDVLDILRNDPYLLDEDNHRKIIIHIFEKKNMHELIENLKSKW